MRRRRVYFDRDRTLITLANCRGVAIVDIEDAHLVCHHAWWGVPMRQTRDPLIYARGFVGGKRTSMHRVILGRSGAKAHVDHINGDTLDNRRANLRFATPAENQKNRRKTHGSSRFKGVHWHKRDRCWVASATVGGIQRQIHWGTDEVAAARAYDSFVKEAYGEFALLNFPEDPKP